MRSLCRQCTPWRSLSLLIAITALVGILTIQRYERKITPSTDDQKNFWSGVVMSLFQKESELNDFNSSGSKYFFLSSDILARNVSKVGQKWFEVLEEEKYLQNNTYFFKRSHTIKNNVNHNFVIKGENICTGSAPFLLVIIPSVVSHTDQRDAIRWTWLRAAETNSWPRSSIRDKIKHIFLFGYTGDNNSEDYKRLSEESKMLGDIVLADFEDTYRNLTRKILIGLNWARQYCQNAQFVLKVDEDTFINVPLMIEVLKHVSERAKRDSFVMGLKHNYHQPIVVRDGRWAVSKEEYPLDFYPKYFYGHTYVLNRQAVIDIADVSHHVTLISPEDAFITGILPKFAGITRISAPSFTVCCRHIYDCEVVWNQNVALPEVKDTKLLATLWSNVITHTCNNTMRFIN